MTWLNKIFIRIPLRKILKQLFLEISILEISSSNLFIRNTCIQSKNVKFFQIKDCISVLEWSSGECQKNVPECPNSSVTFRFLYNSIVVL